MTGYGFTDSQLHGERGPRYHGSVPDAMFPHRNWLTGKSLRERPISAPPGTFFIIETPSQAWLWLHPEYQMGPLTERGSIGRQGLTYYATDTDELFVWQD